MYINCTYVQVIGGFLNVFRVMSGFFLWASEEGTKRTFRTSKLFQRSRTKWLHFNINATSYLKFLKPSEYIQKYGFNFIGFRKESISWDCSSNACSHLTVFTSHMVYSLCINFCIWPITPTTTEIVSLYGHLLVQISDLGLLQNTFWTCFYYELYFILLKNQWLVIIINLNL